MFRTSRRRALLAVALVVAVVGPVALVSELASDGTAVPLASCSAAAAELTKSPPADGGSATAAPVVVIARTETVTKYLDLAIRILALLLAWFLERTENGDHAPKGSAAVRARPGG